MIKKHIFCLYSKYTKLMIITAWGNMMTSKKRKSPFLLEKPSGKLPKGDLEQDVLLELNAELKYKLRQLKMKILD